jgi:osmotically-inducible protein OsmY
MALTRTTLAGAVLVTMMSTAAFAATPAAQPEARDLTSAFRTAGSSVERLEVYEIGGIVIIRGRTASKAEAAEAGTIASSMGYNRVANLVQITPPMDDSALRRRAERELTINRGLDGCNFRVEAHEGVIHLAGRVQHELQKDMAVELVRNLDGVRSVQSELTR